MGEMSANTGLLPGEVPQWRVVRFESIESTNSALLDLGERGEAPGMVYVAGVQTQGRGRLDRRWHTAPGDALLMSALLPPVPAIAEVATRAMAVAVADMCNELGLQAQLKWPNDVLLGGKKLAGILGESRSDGSGLRAVVIGCGLNVKSVPEALSELATCLGDHLGPAVPELDALCSRLLAGLSGQIQAPEAAARHFADRCSTVGAEVKVILADREVHGLARDVASDGRLVVETGDGEPAFFASGDVVHLRPR